MYRVVELRYLNGIYEENEHGSRQCTMYERDIPDLEMVQLRNETRENISHENSDTVVLWPC